MGGGSLTCLGPRRRRNVEEALLRKYSCSECFPFCVHTQDLLQKHFIVSEKQKIFQNLFSGTLCSATNVSCSCKRGNILRNVSATMFSRFRGREHVILCTAHAYYIFRQGRSSPSPLRGSRARTTRERARKSPFV